MTDEPDVEMTADGAATLQRAANAKNDLLVWAITENPKDYPGKYVARPWSTREFKALRYHLKADTLDGLREMLPFGLSQIQRDGSDDAVIVETWV